MTRLTDLPSISIAPESSVMLVGDTTASQKITVSDLRNTLVKTASPTKAGIIKVGSGLRIDPTGVLSVANFSGYVLPMASANALGGVIVGSGLTIDSFGVLKTTATSVPIASQETAGIVKVGPGLKITNAVLSVASVMPYLTAGDQIITEDYTIDNNLTVYSIGTTTIDRATTFTVSANSTWVLYTPSEGTAAIPVEPSPIQEQDQIITANYSIADNKTASSIGPITIDRQVTVEIAADSQWVIF
jgi:hypothetical protein